MRNYIFNIILYCLKSIDFNITSFIDEINDFNKVNCINNIQLLKLSINDDFDNYSMSINLFENGDKINDNIIKSYQNTFNKYNVKFDNQYNIIDDNGASVYTF